MLESAFLLGLASELKLPSSIQYNTTEVSYRPYYRKFSALTRLGDAAALVLQSNCVRRTCPRSLKTTFRT